MADCCWAAVYGVAVALLGSQELAVVLAAVAVGAGAEVSRICSRLVSVSSSFEGVSVASASSKVSVSTGTGSSTCGVGSTISGFSGSISTAFSSTGSTSGLTSGAL